MVWERTLVCPGQALGPQFSHLFQEGSRVNNLCGLSVHAVRPLPSLALQGLEGGLSQVYGRLDGGRQRKWLKLPEPPPVAHVSADPLPAGKSQTQRSDIWEALGSQGIFRRLEADMPGILGVAELKKLGGLWRVDQKRWPQS